ncbi:dipeptide epimerase [Mucilaginibacter auburnensis]|uniref:Dipeptide epimerase n=1 Tax=Mucilaginibacter auburnensis TaxID=1457233 RepID=A0A2H9VQ57_9SPHI|nr:dipeptide epimerase [Mucilaginibacter auburnensis]PJJ80478.1 L-alanine-DL-glutamate epimerase-like enolase superfamily enzyme [Mucilaginibacter auburnensis]
MKLSYRPFDLLLKHSFTISGHSRVSTPLMLVEIEHEGFTGYGEASMVPYLGESIQSATAYLDKIDITKFKHPFNFPEIHQYLDSVSIGNTAIKAAVDIALHDLHGKLTNTPCWQLVKSNPVLMPPTSFTIGIDTPVTMREKATEATGFEVIKVKLGSPDDKLAISAIRSVTDVPLYVDVNQGWTDRAEAIEMIWWLFEQGVVLIEQPMPKHDVEGNAWLTAQSPIPIIGDEAVQRLTDVETAIDVYHGINIKLMKCTGMFEAKQMIDKARECGLKILIGCMSETSCATLAAAALAPQCDWADIDGPFLTTNNPFAMPPFYNGKYILGDDAGLGLKII